MSNIPTFQNAEEKDEYMRQQVNFVITTVQSLVDKKQISDADLGYFIEKFKQATELMAKKTAALKFPPFMPNGIHEGTQYVGPTLYQNQPYQNCSYQNQHLSGLMKDVGQDVPISSQIGVSKQVNKSAKLIMKQKNVQMKRKGKDSAGSRMFKEFMVKQGERQEHLLEILECDACGVNKDDPYSASRCMSIINGMLDGGMMPDNSPLYYLAMDFFEDAVKRELFMTMRSDACRLKWLQHKQDRSK